MTKRITAPHLGGDNPVRLLRLPDVLSRFPVGRSSWYAGIAAGIYPKPLNIGRRSVAWRAQDIASLIASLPSQERAR